MGLTKSELFKRRAIKATVDPTLTQMQSYHASLNWVEMWEDWYLSINPNGRPKYATVHRFAKAKGTNDLQVRFLEYYLGPPLPDGETPIADFAFVQPQCWLAKRETGGWHSDQAIRELHRSISSKMHGLDALREVGNRYGLHSISRAEHLAKTIDAEFSYGRMSEELPYADRVHRMKDYLHLIDRVVLLQQKSINLYARCHGIDLDQLDTEGVASLLSATAIAASESGNGSASRVERAVRQLTEMTLVKSSKFKTPLPPGTETILEGFADELPPDPKKKIQ